MAARAHFQIKIRLWNLKLRKEHVRHISVVVLSSVHQGLPQAQLSDGSHYRGCLHKVWTRANDMQNMLHKTCLSLSFTETLGTRLLSNDVILALCSFCRNAANSPETALCSPEKKHNANPTNRVMALRKYGLSLTFRTHFIISKSGS